MNPWQFWLALIIPTILSSASVYVAWRAHQQGVTRDEMIYEDERVRRMEGEILQLREEVKDLRKQLAHQEGERTRLERENRELLLKLAHLPSM